MNGAYLSYPSELANIFGFCFCLEKEKLCLCLTYISVQDKALGSLGQGSVTVGEGSQYGWSPVEQDWI